MQTERIAQLTDIGVGLRTVLSLLAGDLSYDKRARAKKMIDALMSQVDVVLSSVIREEMALPSLFRNQRERTD